MVKKLIKNEFIYYLRTLGLALPIVLAMGIMTRIFALFRNGNVINEIAIFSSTAMFIIASIALIVLSTVISVVRFYKNMYSSEGYLTFTLPVTNHQHLLVKLCVAMVCQAACFITVFLALGIASFEVVDGFNIFKLVGYLFDYLFSSYGTANALFYIIEGIFILFFGSAFSFLLYYACITVGQTAKKNRILMAVGAYFIYYVATQVISTVLVMIVTLLGLSGSLDVIFEWIAEHPMEMLHIYMTVGAIVYAAFAVAGYFVTHSIMTKKLNLE